MSRQVEQSWDCTFGLTVNQKAPEWQNISIDPIDEMSDINISIGDLCDNDATEFEIGSGTALRTPAPGDPDPPPPPVLSIDNSGNITSDEQAPDVETPETYQYPLTARNTINYPTQSERDANKQEDLVSWC